MSTAIGMALASLLSLAVSLASLVGTQGLHGNEPFFSAFLPYTGLLLPQHLIVASPGLLPLLSRREVRGWGAGVIGFAAGALIESARIAGAVQFCLLGVVLPPACAAVALAVFPMRAAAASR